MAVGKILCIGDSLTAGDESNPIGWRSYRGALQLLLSNAGYTVDFVGRNQLTPATGGTDPDHEGYGGAYISDAGVSAPNASNNISDRVAAMKTALGAVDIIILFIGWNDTYNQPSTAGTRYTSLISSIHSTTWASAKLVLLTLHPEKNKTGAQTGSDYAAWASINSAVTSAVAGSPTTRFLVDLAGLTGSGDAATLLNTLIFDAQNGPEVTTRKGGMSVPSLYGGHLVTSFKSMQDFNAQWTTNVFSRGGPSGAGLYTDTSVQGNPIFINGVQSVVPWLWMGAAPGHNSSNTVLEARNMFAQAWRGSTGNWEFFFQGARPGASGGGDWGEYDVGAPQPTNGVRSDGITSWYRPNGNTMLETWPYDTVPSRGIEGFLGGRNRSLMADAVAFCWGVQVRLALLDPSGTNDIPLSAIFACCGADYATGGGYGGARYDYWGWPLTVQDGGHDRWKKITSTDWVWVGGISLGRNSATYLGFNAEEHFEDPGTPPPLANWSPATPYNNQSTYSKNVTQFRANPPKLPTYVSGSGITTGGWTAADYWDSIHMTQQGADKTARAIYDAMIANNLLTSFIGSGPVSPSLLPGIPAVGAWGARFTTSGNTPETSRWASITVAQNSLPAWSTQGLPVAVVGDSFSAQLSAPGTPTPTYSIVSGAPAWLSCSSSGALSNNTTISGSAATYNVTFQATNAVGSANVTLTLSVIVGVLVTTTSIPSPVVGQTYLTSLAAAGTPPLTWTLQSGTLPAGLSLSSAGVISGTPTTAASYSFTVRATGSTGLYDDQAISSTVLAAGNPPVITTTSLASGTVGTSYTGVTLAATGASPITWAVTVGKLPNGLSLNASTGAITGTPTVSALFPFTVSATNSFSSVSANLMIFVASSTPVSTASVSPWGRFLR